MNRFLHTIFILSLCSIPGIASTVDFFPKIGPYNTLPDTTDPMIFCPGSQIINLEPLHCDTIVHYTINTFDDQGQVILIQLEGIASGGAFPSGPTVNTFLATDLSGNTATCSFTITTLEPLTQPNCQDQAIVLLNQNCAKNLSPFEILEGGPYGCPVHYTIEVDKTMPFGNGPWVEATFGPGDINQSYQVRVTSLLTSARCFGNIQVRDSLPPVIICQNIDVPCALPEDQLMPAFLRDSFGISIAAPSATDACGGNMLAISFVDILQNLPCDDTTTVSGVIRRIWSATDEYGNTGTCEQIIRRHRVLANVQIPENKITSCDNPDLSLETNGLPYIQFVNRRYALTPATYCEFDTDYFDTIQTGNCAGNYTVRRTWKIYDACLPLSSENPKIGVQNILVRDNKGPVIQCPANMILPANDVNCRASVNLPDVFLSDNCSALTSIQAFWTDSSISKNLFGTFQINTDSSGMDTLGVLGTVASFPIGTTTLLYAAEDACGNTGDCSLQLTVANMVAPTAKCDTLLLVGLPTNGYLHMPAAILDNGSTDDCSPLFFKAKLSELNACHSESLLTDTLNICCHNLGDTLLGTLRVYDIAVPQGAVSGTYGAGHFTDCAFKIRVSGSNAPTCTAPTDITVACDAFDPTLNSYGDLLAQSCSVDSVNRTLNLANFDTICSRGTITRIFRVFSANGQMGQCTQKIVVDYHQEYFVHFPEDVVVTACDTNSYYGIPTFFLPSCELFGVTYTDETFTVVPDACFKIERTWKIINWCTYNDSLPVVTVPNPSPNAITNHPDNLVGPIVSPIQTSGDPWRASLVKLFPSATSPTDFSIFYAADVNGYEYKQIIKIIDTQDPVVENCPTQALTIQDMSTNDPQIWNASYWFDPVLVSSDLCESPTNLSITAYDACSGEAINIEYQLFLDLNGDNVRETVINSTNFPPSNTVYFNNSGGNGQAREFDFRPVPANQKWRFGLQEVNVGNRKTATVGFNSTLTPDTYVTPQLPYGNHKIKWTITDGCGNESVCEYSFTIRDGKPPTVICLSPLSVNLHVDGTIQLWATDFLQFADDNCTPQQFLVPAIRKAGTGTGFPTDPNGNPVPSILYDCTELGTQTIELWARDRAGNAGSCMATVNIIDNAGYCDPDPPPAVSGYIQTELNEGIADVHVQIDGTVQFAPPFTLFDLTDGTGFYSFTNSIPLSSNFVLRPDFTVNPLNGLTTYDLVLISKHILGLEALGSPYKIIAADANHSNSITTFDIVEFRKLILGINQVLPNSDSWRFVQKSFVFSNPLNPFVPPFPESITVSGIFTDMTNGDFVGVKMGDVNNSAISNATSSPDDRSAGTLHFNVSSNSRDDVRPGELVDISFASEADLLGCQFTLNVQGLEVLEIIPGANLEQEHFALFPEKNALTFACEKGGKPAFTLKGKVLTAGNLHEMLSIGSRITKAEAYQEQTDRTISRSDLALRFPEMGTFELFQNQPNPFDGATDITFNLPEACEATLKIFDTNGRILFTQTGDYKSGTHTILLEKSALDATGVLFYQLDTPGHSAMRKMVKL